MNGYTPTIELQTRVNNLIAQIPQEYRARACRECYGTDDFDFERNLTGYVMRREWEFYAHPVDEAEFVDGFCFEDELVDTGLNDDRPYKPATGFMQW